MRNGWFRLNMVALALATSAIAATASLVQPSLAQQWPTHPVRFVLPFGPGSGADTAARLITD
jgi:tripartite-type tricarboxylate transporter receptor subunit TctC